MSENAETQKDWATLLRVSWEEKTETIDQARKAMPPGWFDEKSEAEGQTFDEMYVTAVLLLDELQANKLEYQTRMLAKLSDEYYLQEKARLGARRKLAAENFTGTNELSWEDLAETANRYLVEDLLPAESLCFLVAKPNIGKTFAYVDMACRMAFGMPWLGKKTEQVRILIVLAEGRNGFIDRINAWCEANEKDLEDLKPWLRFTDGVNLNNDESLDKVREIVERDSIELIIFDTWANVHGGQSEDDGALNSITLDRALSIRPEATLLFVHHPRKSDEDGDSPVMRGSGSLAGRAEVVLTMFRDKDYKPITGEKEEFLALSTENSHAGKNRTARTETIRGLYLEESGESAVFRQLVAESISSRSRRVIEKLTHAMTAEEFRAAAGMKSKSTAERCLRDALADGVAVVDKSGKAHLYSLAPGVVAERLTGPELLKRAAA